MVDGFPCIIDCPFMVMIHTYMNQPVTELVWVVVTLSSAITLDVWTGAEMFKAAARTLHCLSSSHCAYSVLWKMNKNHRLGPYDSP